MNCMGRRELPLVDEDAFLSHRETQSVVMRLMRPATEQPDWLILVIGHLNKLSRVIILEYLF